MAAIASAIATAECVLDTATSVMSSGLRPAARAASAMRLFTAARRSATPPAIAAQYPSGT
jgi:hypothetical protein